MPITFQQTELDNGLTIIAEVNSDAHTAAAGFFVNTGSRDETADLMGVSHFLEHMMFKGTDRRTADQVNIDFDRIGANYNAFTSQENTAYFAQVLPEYLDPAIDLLSDILRPALRDEDFEMEKNVILEEISMYMDRPFWVAYEHTMEKFFGEHRLSYRVLGTNETIKALSAEQMRGYFQHRYSPDNMVVAMTGQVDFDKCVAQITEACGGWERTGARRDHGQVTPATGNERFADPKFARDYLVMLSPGPSKQDADRYAASVLANVLGDSDGSRLYWKLIDPGLADEADLVFYPFDQTGAYLAYASCSPERSEQVEKTLLDVVDQAGEELDAEEVERSRNKIAMEVVHSSERPMGRLMHLGGSWLANQEYVPLAEELARYEAVNVEAIEALLKRHPMRDRMIVHVTKGLEQ